MDQILTLEQKEQLNSWVSQRDIILLDISSKRVEQEQLIVVNKNLSDSNTEIANKVQQSIGRFEELEKKEKERGLLIIPEIAELSIEKSVLQTQISDIRKEMILLEDKKSNLLRDIENLSAIHDKVFEKVNGLEALVENIVAVNSENTTKINNILIAAGTELQRITAIAAINVDKTNMVIMELPKMMVDIHQDILERKMIIKKRNL